MRDYTFLQRLLYINEIEMFSSYILWLRGLCFIAV